jgi:hypothetical protein
MLLRQKMSRWLRFVRHDLFYAVLGLACALLLAGLPAYLVFSASLSPQKAQAAPAGLEPSVSGTLLNAATAPDVISTKLLATEPREAGAEFLNAPANSICVAATAEAGPHADQTEGWPAPGRGLIVSAH